METNMQSFQIETKTKKFPSYLNILINSLFMSIWNCLLKYIGENKDVKLAVDGLEDFCSIAM